MLPATGLGGSLDGANAAVVWSPTNSAASFSVWRAVQTCRAGDGKFSSRQARRVPGAARTEPKEGRAHSQAGARPRPLRYTAGKWSRGKRLSCGEGIAEA